MDEDNGILAQIRGEYIARAANSLPPTMAGEDTYASVEIEVPGIGPVRIRFQLMSHRHGSGRSWFWTATFAELAP
jgi:hypothetical protein